MDVLCFTTVHPHLMAREKKLHHSYLCDILTQVWKNVGKNYIYSVQPCVVLSTARIGRHRTKTSTSLYSLKHLQKFTGKL
jgi:hypothetical protein